MEKVVLDITMSLDGFIAGPNDDVSRFVLSKDIPKTIPAGSTSFTFVTDGIESAVRQAKKAAGKKNVYLMGGANKAPGVTHLKFRVLK